MSRTRIVALLLLAAGCGKPDAPPAAAPTGKTPTPAPAAVAPVVSPPAVAKTAPPVAVDLQTATAAATKLLIELAVGKADPAAVAPEFQKTLAGGDSGKASWATEQYLAGFVGKVSATPPTVAALPDGSALAVAPPAPTAGRVVARLAKTGSDWRVTWLHQAPAGPVPDLVAGPDLPQRFAVAAFVEPALTNQPRLAEAALDPTGRTTLAPPLGNDPLGFSRGILSNKLKSFAGGATGYTLAGVGPTATGELLGPGSDKRPFKLVLAGGAVADFEPR